MSGFNPQTFQSKTTLFFPDLDWNKYIQGKLVMGGYTQLRLLMRRSEVGKLIGVNGQTIVEVRQTTEAKYSLTKMVVRKEL